MTPLHDDCGAFEALSEEQREPVQVLLRALDAPPNCSPLTAFNAQVGYLPENVQSLLDTAVAHCCNTGGGPLMPPLWFEAELLDRLRSRHKSQHRRSRVYARLCEVRIPALARLVRRQS
jgi:hypothetical protein